MVAANPTHDDRFVDEPLPVGTKVLTIDLGTSYFKVALFNRKGELELVESAATPVDIGDNGRAEIDVDAFRGCVAQLVQTIHERAGGFDSVRAVSFASQANSFALFDANNNPVTPFILWSDARAEGDTAIVEELSVTPGFYQQTGVPRLNHLFLPAKLNWLRKNQPGQYKRAARIALISDYLTFWVTGHWCTEASIAGLTGLANIHSLHWLPESCSKLSLDISRFSPVVNSGTVIGAINPQVRHDWGLPAQCSLVVGCLDQYAGALGMGATAPDVVVETTGTVLAVVRLALFFNEGCQAQVFQGSAYRPGYYYQMALSELSAGLLERYRRLRTPELSFAQLDELAATAPPGAAGLKVCADAFHRPIDEIFVGRTSDHTPTHEVRAILEAVANELRRLVGTLVANERPACVISGGGASRSELWRQIKSQGLGCPVVVTECEEAASRGAALLALSALSGVAVENVTADKARSIQQQEGAQR